MVTLATRCGVLAELARIAGDDDYAVDLEQSIALVAYTAPDYGDLAFSTMSMLEANRAWIVANVAAGEVAAAPWRRLCHGLAVIEDEAADLAARERLDALLAENVDSVRARIASHARAMCCRKCGSTDISTEMSQTRGGDEGMTQFNTCQSCGEGWSVR